jgi:hypothetical protein
MIVIDDERLASKLVEKLMPALSAQFAALVSSLHAPAQRYADAKNNPLGSPSAFLDAARAGGFPTFRRKRRITALWENVERYLERRKIARGARPSVAASTPPEIDIGELVRTSRPSKRGARTRPDGRTG